MRMRGWVLGDSELGDAGLSALGLCPQAQPYLRVVPLWCPRGSRAAPVLAVGTRCPPAQHAAPTRAQLPLPVLGSLTPRARYSPGPPPSHGPQPRVPSPLWSRGESCGALASSPATGGAPGGSLEPHGRVLPLQPHSGAVQLPAGPLAGAGAGGGADPQGRTPGPSWGCFGVSCCEGLPSPGTCSSPAALDCPGTVLLMCHIFCISFLIPPSLELFSGK